MESARRNIDILKDEKLILFTVTSNIVYDESSESNGRMVSLVIHPWMSGQPHRIWALRRALTKVMGYNDVWSASGSQILKAFQAG